MLTKGSTIKMFRLIAVLAIIAGARPARANQVWGNVTQVVSEFMPGQVLFLHSAVTTPCTQTGNTWLIYSSANADATKAVLATVLAALLAQRQVWVDYNPTTCVVGAVHIA